MKLRSDKTGDLRREFELKRSRLFSVIITGSLVKNSYYSENRWRRINRGIRTCIATNDILPDLFKSCDPAWADATSGKCRMGKVILEIHRWETPGNSRTIGHNTQCVSTRDFYNPSRNPWCQLTLFCLSCSSVKHLSRILSWKQSWAFLDKSLEKYRMTY